MRRFVIPFFLCVACLLSSQNVVAQWQVVNSTPYLDVSCLLPNGNALYSGSASGAANVTTDLGVTWNVVSAVNHANTFAAANGFLFAGTDSGVLRSMDGGATWAASSKGLNNMRTVAFGANGNTLFAAVSNGIYSSIDNGANWVPVDTSTPSKTTTTGFPLVRSFLVNNGFLYIGAELGVLRSADNGATFQVLDTDLFVKALFVNNGKIFVSTSFQGVYASTDNGATWSLVNTGIGSDVFAFAAVGNTVFAATDGLGIFRSTDNGVTWSDVNDSLLYTNVQSLAIQGGYLFAAAQTAAGGGVVLRRPLTELATAVQEQPANAAPAALTIPQNYPNPFTGATTIMFSLPQAEPVALHVYNAIGQEVASLAQGTMEAGQHSVPFNGGSLQSGVYVVRLTAGNETKSSTMMMVK